VCRGEGLERGDVGAVQDPLDRHRDRHPPAAPGDLVPDFGGESRRSIRS
jgi:hypothetical protein